MAMAWVSGGDLIAVQQNFSAAGAFPNVLLPGDTNHDGLVTGAELIAIQQNFGAIGSAVAILEPASVLWLTGLGAGIGCCRAPWRRTGK